MTATEQATKALRRIAYLLERAGEPTYRVKAFRTAAAVVDALPVADLQALLAADTLTELAGIGAVTAQVIEQAVRGQVPAYLEPPTVRWRRAVPGSGRGCAGTCTCTRTGPTAARRSGRWLWPPPSSATPTSH
jgi:hypothetical protein